MSYGVANSMGFPSRIESFEISFCRFLEFFPYRIPHIPQTVHKTIEYDICLKNSQPPIAWRIRTSMLHHPLPAFVLGKGGSFDGLNIQFFMPLLVYFNEPKSGIG